MGADFLYEKDSDFDNGYNGLVTKLPDYRELLNLSDDEVAMLQNNYASFKDAYDGHIMKQYEAKSFTSRKNSVRKASVEDLQVFIRRIDANPNMTDAIRANLGLTVSGHRSSGSLPDMLTAPQIKAVTVPGQVTLYFGTNLNGRGRIGKPSWALGTNIYRKIGDEQEYTFVRMFPKPPYIEEYNGPAVQISYVARYLAKDGRVGPQSQAVNVAALGILRKKSKTVQLSKAA